MTTRLLPLEIHKPLRRLRHRIRTYVVLEGVALLVALVCLLFWISLGLDVAYFQLNRLELPRWFRMAFDVVAVGVLASVVVVVIGLRALKRLRLRALALLLEHRFPSLRDGLITSVEMGRPRSGSLPDLTLAMLQRTIDQTTSALSRIDLSQVFAQRRLQRLVWLAALLVLGSLGFALSNREAMDRWKSGFLLLEPEYWQREYHLQLKVLAQPGDRVRDFADLGAAYEYKHARGEPLTVLVQVDRTKKTPDTVELRYRMTQTRSRGRVFCTRVDEFHFKHTFGELFEDLQLGVTGGDYTNRKPYRIKLVEPPRVEQVTLDCVYPEYMARDSAVPVQGSDGIERDRLVVLGRQVSLPAETLVLLQADCNKTLVGLRVEFPPYQLAVHWQASESNALSATVDRKTTEREHVAWPTGTSASAILSRFTEDGQLEQTTELPSEVASRFFSAERKQIRFPFVLTSEASEVVRTRNRRLRTPCGPPFVMPPDTTLRMYLEDTDQIIGTEPAQFTINGVPDMPPSIETTLRGIGTSITPKAVVPIAGIVRDDYGLMQVQFEYKVDQSETWAPQALTNPPRSQPREFHMHGAEREEFERFPVGPLDLSIGQRLTLAVSAEDGDVLNGPHKSYGEKFSFHIVSNEELLSLLYQRELNLRQRFEQVILELKDSRQSLTPHILPPGNKPSSFNPKPKAPVSSAPLAPQVTTAHPADQATSIATSTQRTLQTLRKDANESLEVELTFRDIREEIVNNAVQTRLMLERIDDRLLAPLDRINTQLFPNADAALGLLKLAVDNRQDVQHHLEAGVEALTTLIDRMERVLQEMRKLETFQEVLETLKAIIEDQQNLSEETKREQKKKLLDRLKNLGLD